VIESTFANVYPSALNIAIVTMMAVIGIAVGKWLFAKFNVPGLSDLFGSI
jgi:hypothetical protein